jgi:hypothetical protein
VIRRSLDGRADTPEAANGFLEAMRGLFEFAVEYGYATRTDGAPGRAKTLIEYQQVKVGGTASYLRRNSQDFGFCVPPCHGVAQKETAALAGSQSGGDWKTEARQKPLPGECPSESYSSRWILLGKAIANALKLMEAAHVG